MAIVGLSQQFQVFFKRINPSPSFIAVASREYASIVSLIENKQGSASSLSPQCFLQGSYKQKTAIHSINDIDIVVLCQLWQPGSGVGGSEWSRDRIFNTISAPLLNTQTYKDKVQYHSGSMCIKIDLGIKVEILPVVFKQGNNDPLKEPFRLYRPTSNIWEDGFARLHQAFLTAKNDSNRTESNFIPMIKVIKHIRTIHGLDTISFHIECLLHSIPDQVFKGSSPNSIAKVIHYIANMNDDSWATIDLRTPCNDRDIFTSSEWSSASWSIFYQTIQRLDELTSLAIKVDDSDLAIKAWQAVLGDTYFPHNVQ